MNRDDTIDIKSDELYKISLDAVEESADTAWHSLLHNLSNANLEKLQVIFKNKCDDEGSELGLTEDEFIEAFCSFYEGPQYSLQAKILFEGINENIKKTITWNDFLDYVIKSMYPESTNKLSLNVSSIEPIAHAKNELVTKIVLIETEQYFSYAIILKHGRVGLYDGNINFLTSYHAIMTREDLTRPEMDRRRRNRWVTDAIFCPDCLMFIITNTARSIMIYEASGLNHVPYWLILSTPNIIECLSYKPFIKTDLTSYSNSVLFLGDCNGEIMSFTFLQPKNGLLRRKRSDNITLFYWNDFVKEKDHVIVKKYGIVHTNAVNHIQFVEELKLLISCSKDANAALVLKSTEYRKKTIYYKVESRGVSCFAISISSNMLITGSDDGTIRLWNIFISKPIALLSQHRSEIIDIQIIENLEMFIACSFDGVLKLWDIKDHTCLQTIKLKFPSFGIHGKLIEWGINSIYPGPKRKQPSETRIDENKRECFGIQDINEMKFKIDDALKRLSVRTWERSCILVTCCNYMAILRTNFIDASVEYSFTDPILPPPPLQNSVLVPADWGLQSGSIEKERFDVQLKLNIEKQLENLKFILDKNILEEEGRKSDINYKIAILESKKEKMRSKVALGSPYLALDLHEFPDIKLSEDIPISNLKQNEQYVQNIQNLLKNAAHKDEVFLSPEPSPSRLKSSKSSIVELPY